MTRSETASKKKFPNPGRRAKRPGSPSTPHQPQPQSTGAFTRRAAVLGLGSALIGYGLIAPEDTETIVAHDESWESDIFSGTATPPRTAPPVDRFTGDAAVPQVATRHRGSADRIRRAAIHVSEISRGAWRWPNLDPRWFAVRYRPAVSEEAGMFYMDYRILDIVDTLFGEFGTHRVVSGYRSPAYNAHIRRLSIRRNGGRSGVARFSPHRLGLAVDISTERMPVGRFVQRAQELGGLGFGFYPSSAFIHIDVFRARTWGRRPRAWRV